MKITHFQPVSPLPSSTLPVSTPRNQSDQKKAEMSRGTKRLSAPLAGGAELASIIPILSSLPRFSIPCRHSSSIFPRKSFHYINAEVWVYALGAVREVAFAVSTRLQ